MNSNERVTFIHVNDDSLFKTAVNNTTVGPHGDSVNRRLAFSIYADCFFVYAIETFKVDIDKPIITTELDRLITNLATLGVEYKIVSLL